MLYVGEIGVGGGAWVPASMSSSLVDVLGAVASVSVSDPEEDRSSSSQLSATGSFIFFAGLDLVLEAGPVLRESLETAEVISLDESLLVMTRTM